MLQQLAPESDLLHSVTPPKFSRRSRFHINVVVVKMIRPPRDIVRARTFLVVDVADILFAKCAVVKPVVAHPAIDHRIHGHCNFQRRMRIHQRHQGCEAIVRNSENANFAVAFGNVFHQPVDGVVSVGRVIDQRRIQRPVQRTVHHIIAFGSIFAAHVLHHANVAAFDDHFGGVVIAFENRSQVGTLRLPRLLFRAVGRARKQHRRVFRAFGDNDHRKQLDAVPHGNHYVALDIVEAVGRRSQRRRRFVGETGLRGTLSAGRLDR